MKIPDQIRPFVMPAAWLATAAVTFGLGRLTSFVDSGPETHSAASGHQSGSSSSFFGGDGANGKSDGGLVGATGSHGTIEELTGGKPLDQWLKHLLGQDDEIARMTGFMMLLERVNTPDEFKQALDTVLQNNGNGNGPGRNRLELSMLLQKWSKMDAKSAMAYAQDIKDNSKFAATNAVLQTWAKTNPQEAIAWAKANGAANADPQGGGGSPGGFGAGGNFALTTVIGQLAKTDLGQALQLAQEDTAGGRTGGMMANTLVNQLISQRGEDGARDAVLGITDDTLRTSMIRQLTNRIAGDDPQKAVDFANSLPAGTAKSQALASAVAQWAQQDAAAAAAYMTTLPVGADSDAPRASLARSVERTDPAGAAAWASSITDPQTRTNSITQVVASWMRTDAAAAQQWVASSTLPDDTKAAVLAAATAPRTFGGGGFQRGGGGGGGGGGGAAATVQGAATTQGTTTTGTAAPTQRRGGRTRGGGGGGGGAATN